MTKTEEIALTGFKALLSWKVPLEICLEMALKQTEQLASIFEKDKPKTLEEFLTKAQGKITLEEN